MIYILCACSFALGFAFSYIIRIQVAKKKVNQELLDEEQKVQVSIQQLQNQYAALQTDVNTAESNFKIRQLEIKNEIDATLAHYTDLKHEQELAVNELVAKRTNLLVAIDDLKEAQRKNAEAGEQAAKDIQTYAIALAAENIEKRAKELQQEYEQYEQKYHDDMVAMMQEAVKRYQEITTNAQAESDHALETLADLRARIDAIVENNKRAAQEASQRDFYRLQLTETDIAEIQKIRSIESYLRSAEPLNKVIWKVYYEKAYVDLIGRVLGTSRKTGIYKITNLENGMCYVGQSVDIAERWKQHIKRGIGADTPTRNKLYPAMLKVGVENFTFELLEECPILKLDEREQYWQEVFHAKDFGYSIK